MTQRMMKTLLSGLGAASLLLGGVTGCSDNNDFGTTDQAAAQLSAPQNGAIALMLPTREGQPIEQSAIRFQSTGTTELIIESIEWVGEKPDRVFMGNSRQGDVPEADCSSEVYYPASMSCVTTGAPDFSEPLPNGQTFEIPLHVAAFGVGEPNTIQCPEADESVPAQFTDRYCGAIQVTTNGLNDSQRVTQGDFTVYLQADRTSGELTINQASLNFQNVGPGFMDTRTFSMSNTGAEPLTIQSISVSELGSLLTLDITQDELPLELTPGEAREVTLTVDLGADIPQGQLDLLADPERAPKIVIDSSAPNSPFTLDLVFDTSQTILPILQTDTQNLSFADDTTQSFTLTNPGDTPATVNGVNFEPSGSGDAYELQIEGMPFAQGMTKVIRGVREDQPDRNTEEFEVVYTPPMNGPAPLTTMVINYTFFEGEVARSSSVRIVLLGDQAMVSYADLVPTVFNFSTRTSDTQRRKAMLRNLGTAPLNLTNIELGTPQLGGAEEFTIATADGTPFADVTVAPGGAAELSITFNGTDQQPDRVNATVTSDSAAGDILLTLVSADAAPSEVELNIVAAPAEPVAGDLVLLSFGEGITESVARSAQWVLLEKPSGSDAALKIQGDTLGFVPDVAGDYTFVVTAIDGSVDVQTTYTITVE